MIADPSVIKEEPKDVTFTITMRSGGHITINGPLTNKPLCLWMLEVGKGLMMNFTENKIIGSPKHSIMDFARRRR